MSANHDAESRPGSPAMEIAVHPATVGMFSDGDNDNAPLSPELRDAALAILDNAARS